MPSVADCLRQHAPAYLEKFGERVPVGHRKVIGAITRCRTGELGGVIYQCVDRDCGREHWVGRSCGNRHCPTCQIDKAAAWLEKQTSRLLPVHHFLVTFTVPQEVRMMLRANQRDGYNGLFAAGRDTIRDVAGSTRSLRGCQLGFFGVLHTWGRDPTVYHPHVHFVVPGGGVSEDGTKWMATPENFLLHHGTAVKVYKAKFADAMRAAGLYDQVPKKAWRGKWVVDIKPVGDGKSVLKYLAPYVYRVAISDKRILACDDKSVTFRYTPTGAMQAKPRPVTGPEFVRGFVQHVLPRGFQKVRYVGWMSSNSRLGLDDVRWLVWLFLGWTYWLASGHAPQPKRTVREPPRCAECGSAMRIVGVLHINCRVLVEHSVAYLDSG
ncbi:MAG: transposase [Pirellulaceae bacterium]|nr:transposase [Pirellulaceae bacterium]MDP6553633.1 transposase [Pirellulaceae bacterium]MDP6721337.1 transposase [Pirellulaceae bacterium]